MERANMVRANMIRGGMIPRLRRAMASRSWLFVGIFLLAGCSTDGCSNPIPDMIGRLGGSQEPLSSYQIEATKRDFCEKFQGRATFEAGQTGSTAPRPDDTPANLPALLQPYLRVTINGQSAEMNDVMLKTMRSYLDGISWPDGTTCQNAVLVLSENAILLEFPNVVADISEPRRGLVTVTMVSISSAWQKGPDRIWRLLQVHMSQGEREVPESQIQRTQAASAEGEEGAASGAGASAKPRGDFPGW